MILYNTTFCIDEHLETEFIDFAKDIFIPSAYACGLGKGLLSKIRAPKEMNSLSGQPTVNYALQFRAPSENVCSDFANDVLPRLFEAMGKNLQQGINIYCTLLDIVHDQDNNG